jgi:tRNA threonylcarbamoyl adenosine modification protein YeaZ
MILAFDTSSALTSVAVADGQRVVIERRHLDARRHAEALAPLLMEVLAGVDGSAITSIACGVGPGPYTGLRVGIASALAVGAAWAIPVHGVCSLDAMAAAVLDTHGVDAVGGVCIASDARRREVYWARYSADGSRVDGPRVARPDEVGEPERRGDWAGHGAAIHAASFGPLLCGDDSEDPCSYPHASWVARCAASLLAAGESMAQGNVPLDAHGQDSGATSRALAGATLLLPRPLYLRRPDAVAPGGTS